MADNRRGKGSNDDDLAYGHLYEPKDGATEGNDRGIIGDTFRRFRHGHQAQSGPSVTEQYQPQLAGGQPAASQSTAAPSGSGSASGSAFDSLLNKGHSLIHGLGKQVAGKISSIETHSHTHAGQSCAHEQSNNRFASFAPERSGNDIKWYVDGCGYMWAVSEALEKAQKSIWILDWWLSPELYLRRPPSKYESYRVDRLLLAAAQRGVKVNIIVYKEVTQALTRKYLSPSVPSYLERTISRQANPALSFLVKAGLAATFSALEHAEADSPLIEPPITVDSSHTKHHLEDLHRNIAVFRHPDHLPDAQTLQSSFISSVQNLSLTAASASKLPTDAFKAIYGMNDDVVLYWAHHEKLCLIDGTTAFMGGLDLCYGRWDTNQHSIADAHPEDLQKIIFPGQDYNNARIMDFQHVDKWDENKLDRTKSSRMGWSDISVCLSGPVTEDLRAHFVQRWNFIYDEKYNVRKDSRYSRLTMGSSFVGASESGQPSTVDTNTQPQAAIVPQPGATQQPYFPPPPTNSRGIDESEGGTDEDQSRGFGGEGGLRGKIRSKITDELHRARDEFGGSQGSTQIPPTGPAALQIVRSCSKWSHGVPTEHSIANAYIDIIKNSQHFVYMENQFFITATSDKQRPIKNQVAAAIVERIIRAAKEGQKYKFILIIPSVPAFAGDLRDEDALGTRAIMEFQYDSINRGGYSIYEQIAKAGFDPTEYIRFYNLRSYDRINSSAVMKAAEVQSGVSYEEARKQHDDAVGAGYGGSGEGTGAAGYNETQKYQAYQQGAAQVGGAEGLASGIWDSVSDCYMLGGADIRTAPWAPGNEQEIDAFVSEELYVHSKVLIADDRIVICGSANMNDRSQLGDHDSEIAVIVEDPTPLESSMNGQPWQASKFAASLRRQLFRKHLGLIPSQNCERPDQNFAPIGTANSYDTGSAEDQLVADPLSDNFLNFWNNRARQNTESFRQVFHPVPDDTVKNWKDYDSFYGKYFHKQGTGPEAKAALYGWGHVVKENFAAGDQGLKEVKDVLSTIKGTLVEMPLQFLIEEDIAKEGVSLNAFTEEVYT